MKGLIILGLSLALGESLKFKVDIQALPNEAEPDAAEPEAAVPDAEALPEPLTGQAPVWESPDWEGYPCDESEINRLSICPGFKKTYKVWDKSVGCKKLPESFNYTPLKIDDGPDGFPRFVEKCQHKCMDGNDPPKCSLIETKMGNPQWMCILKSCTNATGPIWAPEPNETRAGQWLGWQRVPPGWWIRKYQENIHDHVSKRQLY